MKYIVRFKGAAPIAASVFLTAKNQANALFEGARMLGMDTDPFTQTYTMALEAIPVENEGVQNDTI